MHRRKLIGLHLGLLALFLANLSLELLTGIRLQATIVFCLKLVCYLAAVGYFLLAWRHRSFLKYYTGIYVVAPLLVFIGFLIDGILGAVLGSVFLFFLYPQPDIKNHGNFALKTEFSGLLGSCCTYGIYENKLLLFEIKRTTFKAESPEAEIVGFHIFSPQLAEVRFKVSQAEPEKMLINLP